MCTINKDGSEAGWLVYYREGDVWAEQVCDNPSHWDGSGLQVLASGMSKVGAEKFVTEELAIASTLN